MNLGHGLIWEGGGVPGVGRGGEKLMSNAGGLVGLSPKFLNLMYNILFTFLFRNNFLNLCLIV